MGELDELLTCKGEIQKILTKYNCELITREEEWIRILVKHLKSGETSTI